MKYVRVVMFKCNFEMEIMDKTCCDDSLCSSHCSSFTYTSSECSKQWLYETWSRLFDWRSFCDDGFADIILGNNTAYGSLHKTFAPEAHY